MARLINMSTDFQISSCWEHISTWNMHTEYIYIFFFINWTLRMIDNLPERVQILCHVHIICITVLENRIICCWIFCDLLLKNWFTGHETDRFLNNHCQECVRAYLSIHDCLSFLHEVMIGNHRNKATEINQSPQQQYETVKILKQSHFIQLYLMQHLGNTQYSFNGY
jgi:hypothetical protein